MRIWIYSLLTLVSCVNSFENKFEGHWYYCGHAGDYQEIHISPNKFFRLYTFMDWNSPHNYSIKNDTLFCSDTLINWIDESGNPGIVETVITQVSKNQLNVKFIDYEYTFHSMPEEFKFNIDQYTLDTSSENKFLTRQEYFSCPDLRSVEEKQKDSLMLKILDDIMY